jgi:hypothetical protein
VTQDEANSTGDGQNVGYGRPPRHSRFKPGQSGNPTGKRKGVQNFSTEVKRALSSPVTITNNGRSRNVSTQRAALMRLCEKGLKGDSRALDRLIDLGLSHNSSDQTNPGSNSLAEDEAILEAFKKENLERAAANLGPPRRASSHKGG